MRVLVACDKFKDALPAEAVCRILAGALPDGVTTDLCPLTDGGEGFGSILTQALAGRTAPVKVAGPRGGPVEAMIGLVPANRLPAAARKLIEQAGVGLPTGDDSGADVAVVEMAMASGLALLPPAERDPWQTTSGGTGELLRAAASLGARAIVLGVGGSATHDLGLGALSALGLRCETISRDRIHPPFPARWPEVAGFAGQLAALPPIGIACDVRNPLLGSDGAAAVFGPQKGLRSEDFPRLEYMTGRLAVQLCTWTGRPIAACTIPGSGAAGGIAFGLGCALDARLLPGADLVSAWLDLDARIDAADVVITGEGRFDATSLSGKGPGAVARRALARGKPVHVFAGQISGTEFPAGLHLHAITPGGMPLAEALPATGALLQAALARVHLG